MSWAAPRGRDGFVSFGGHDVTTPAAPPTRSAPEPDATRSRPEPERDRVGGGPGPDRLFGNAGRDLLLGGSGGDFINGGPGLRHLPRRGRQGLPEELLSGFKAAGRRRGRSRRVRACRPPEGIESSVEVELRGLSIYTHHGVTDAEQEIGQRLEFDVSFDVPDCDAVLTDRLEDTVDYAEVCDIVALAATERNYRTLERLCRVVAERLAERFGCESVQVRAAKPEPPLPVAIDEVAVEVTHEPASDDDEDEDAAGG